MSSIRVGVKQVKPILSISHNDARKRAITLYKTVYRHIPQLLLDYDIPKSEEQCRQKLRELFKKNQNVTDLRVIDMMIVKGQMQFQEFAELWAHKGRLLDLWEETIEKKPTDFMSKFLSGQDTTI